MKGIWKCLLPFNEAKINAVVFAWTQLWKRNLPTNDGSASWKTVTTSSVSVVFESGGVLSNLRIKLFGMCVNLNGTCRVVHCAIRNMSMNSLFDAVAFFRACPECRVCSDFVTPSAYWVEAQEDKSKLIENYKKALR